jgi:hypothetical protein
MTQLSRATASTLLLLAALSCDAWSDAGPAVPTAANTARSPEAKSIPFDLVGVEAQKHYEGDGISIHATHGGAYLRNVMQDLEGNATSEGLWLSSTAEEDTGKPNRFRVRAVGVERGNAEAGSQTSEARAGELDKVGVVKASGSGASFARPGLIEEYFVSMDGVRQDFVVRDRPAGEGSLQVVLDVTGATAQEASYGAKLTVSATERQLAYSRLKVIDAQGRELAARIKVDAPSQLRVIVEDDTAVYPVRIDPTFSDADWIGLGVGVAGTDNVVRAVAVDAAGALYIGGDFSTVGGLEVNHIAKWNGSSWSGLGSGMNGHVYALAVSGSTVYAGGFFSTAGGVTVNQIARWNGTAWSALGNGVSGFVQSLAVSGANLYVGGFFTQVDVPAEGGTGIEASCIARWNGSSWAALGDGFDSAVTSIVVRATTLYAGGLFVTDGAGNGTNLNHVARWTGSTWVGLGPGLSGSVNAMVSTTAGLYVGGSFEQAGTLEVKNIARWTGSAWLAVGPAIDPDDPNDPDDAYVAPGVNGPVNALAASGTTIYVGGSFTQAGRLLADNVARWNGTAWSAVGQGVGGEVMALAVSGANVYVGGQFSAAGGTVTVSHIARWNGATWDGLSNGLDGTVNALAVSGTTLYAGGQFTNAGKVPVNYIARWNGSAWSALGTGMDGEVKALAVSGTNVYAGGFFVTAGGVAAAGIARWDGTKWNDVGGGVDGFVQALAVRGSEVFVGGGFQNAGGSSANNVARWNGASWSPLGSGVGGALVAPIYALAVNATYLYAGGVFDTAGEASANNVARWDGVEWTPLGSGIDSFDPLVRALALNGNLLYVGGSFSSAGGIAANRVACWNGDSWSPLGDGLNDSVNALAVQGSSVYAGGGFTESGGDPVNYVARWNGAEWTPLGSGTDNAVLALAVNGATLYVGGQFASAGTKVASFAAQAPVRFPSALLGSVTITATSVTLQGSVNPQGSVATAQFEYGVDTGYGSTTPATVSPNGGAAFVNVSKAVTGLTPGLVYHYRLAVTNATGTSYTDDATFVIPEGTLAFDPAVGAVLHVFEDVVGGVVKIPIIRTGPSGGSVSVTASTTNGSAVAPSDYTALVNVPVIFGDGVSTDDLEIPILNPANTNEGTETFTVKLSGPFVTPAGVSSITVRIINSDVGKSVTITAMPQAGQIFVGWTLRNALSPGLTQDAIRAQIGVAANALEKPTLTFIYRSGVELIATFADNPYDATGAGAIAGTYNGLIKASPDLPERDDPAEDGSTPGMTTEGCLTATVMSTGAFSGRLTIDGMVLNAAGIFDHEGRARFGTARAQTLTVARPGKPSLVVKFDIGGPPDSVVLMPGKIVGQVTVLEFQKSKTGSVSTVEADRAFFNGLAIGTTVPDPYLTVTGTAPSPTGRTDGVFTVVLPSVPLGSQPVRISEVLTEQDYPRGDGVATLRVTKGGGVSLAGTLADGTPVTMTGTLSHDLRVDLFAQLYSKKGFLSAPIKLDAAQTDSDLKREAGEAVLWNRPFNSSSHYYPYGWAETLELDLLGAKYAVKANESVVRAANGVKLQAEDGDGNVTLTISDGQLDGSLVKSANLSTADFVTKVPVNDPTFTMLVNRTTGAVTGGFDHTNDTKPAYNIIIFQKGPNAGAYGYFLTKQPALIDYTGESGGVSLIGQP